MLTLCGFAISNYYNKVKMALLEKNIPFIEEHVPTGSTDAAVLRDSPLAKIPFIRTPDGAVCESQVIMDYLDDAYPEVSLRPAQPYAAAKMRELITYIDWHLEIPARELYGHAFYGKPASEATQARVRKTLERNIAAFARLVKFEPFIAGTSFSQADCAAFVSLPLIGMTTKAVYGEDLLLAGGVDYKAYTKLIGERASAQKVVADRKAASQKKA
jgi:glutathione S-transferase